MFIFIISIVIILFSKSSECGNSDQSCDFPDTVHCADMTKCIHVSDICDFIPDCPDSSDENPDFCLHWPRTMNCGLGHVMCLSPENYVLNYCITLSEACRKGCSEMPSVHACKIVEGKQLPPNDHRVGCSSTQNKELFEFLTEAFAGTSKNETNGCPSLYNRVADSCISFFRPAKVTFEEAKLFCESINGELAKVDDVVFFQTLLNEMKESEGDFWVGGQFSKGNWSWLDGSSVEMGSPYWGLYRSSTCESDGCESTSIMPKSSIENQCIAMSSVHHYYFSDEGCYSKRSPLCTRKPSAPTTAGTTTNNETPKVDEAPVETPEETEPDAPAATEAPER